MLSNTPSQAIKDVYTLLEMKKLIRTEKEFLQDLNVIPENMNKLFADQEKYWNMQRT